MPSSKTDSAPKQLSELRARIQRHNALYHEQAAPEITDQQYDALYAALVALEAAHPNLVTADSPTQTVGGHAILDAFQPAQHLVRMQSLDNTYSEAEVAEFVRRMQRLLPGEDIPLTVEPKVDGVAISLLYEGGKFVRAVTRGDGTTGDDVTGNARTIRSIPDTLLGPAPDRIEIRGEIYLPKTEFVRVNAERDEAGLPAFANPRNTAAGTLKQLDSRVAASRNLGAVFYGFGLIEGDAPGTQSAFMDWLKSAGLPTTEWQRLTTTIDETLAAIRELGHVRHDFVFETDGAVLKANHLEQQRALGSTSKAPRWAMAYKYESEQAETRLHDITVQVGRTGVLTPVAELDPVTVSGSNVARATLHNEEEIARKDIRIGDTVVIEKAGEVIPAVIRVRTDLRTGDERTFEMPTHCPACNDPVVREDGFVAVRCVNLHCPAQTTRLLEHFAMRGALDIEGLGDKVALTLVERGLARSPLDLFDLTLDVLGPLNLGTTEEPRTFGEKNARKLLDALERARTAPLWRWLFALAIPDIGAVTARDIGELHPDLAAVANSEILRDTVRLHALNEQITRENPASRSHKDLPKEEREAMKPAWETLKQTADELAEKLIAAHAASPSKAQGKAPRDANTRIGPVAATAALRWFESEPGRQLLAKLTAHGINPVAEPPTTAESTDGCRSPEKPSSSPAPSVSPATRSPTRFANTAAKSPARSAQKPTTSSPATKPAANSKRLKSSASKSSTSQRSKSCSTRLNSFHPLRNPRNLRSNHLMPTVQSRYATSVVPTYGRFDLVIERGSGSRVWDDAGREFLDFGGGIAVCSLGHAHPRVTAAVTAQAATLVHTSNLYYTRPQIDLAERLVDAVGTPGKIFCCNSGAEANEGLIKTARRFGSATSRHHIITFTGSFHGRTMAGISATGQDKVKTDFGPLLDGFTHVPLGDLAAVRASITPHTAAILIEPIQGEGGIHPAEGKFLTDLRALCDQHDLLLLFDEVQCGLGRTGHYSGWHAIPGATDVVPDGISWAKGIANGFPLGAFWIRDRPTGKDRGALCDLLGPGSHGTTYGGNPVACAAALAVFDEIEEKQLLAHVRMLGAIFAEALADLDSPHITDIRALGLMIGVELTPDDPALGALAMTKKLMAARPPRRPRRRPHHPLPPPTQRLRRRHREGRPNPRHHHRVAQASCLSRRASSPAHCTQVHPAERQTPISPPTRPWPRHHSHPPAAPSCGSPSPAASAFSSRSSAFSAALPEPSITSPTSATSAGGLPPPISSSVASSSASHSSPPT